MCLFLQTLSTTTKNIVKKSSLKESRKKDSILKKTIRDIKATERRLVINMDT